MQTVTLQHNNATELQAAVASRWRARYAKLGGGTGCGTGGPHTAATDGPGGPNFAGDHVRRDRARKIPVTRATRYHRAHAQTIIVSCATLISLASQALSRSGEPEGGESLACETKH